MLRRTMGILRQRLATGQVLVADGAWGTLLIGMGLGSSDLPEEWNVSHPKEVQSVAAAYAKAGADVILSDTFGGSSIKLHKAGCGCRVREFNTAGARNSLAGAPNAVIAASVGPTGEFLEPVGELTAAQLEAVFREQIQALYDAGVRCVDIETMSALDEALCAARAAKAVSQDLDVIVSMTFERTPKGFRTMTGVTPAKAARELTASGVVDVVGTNCGNGIEQMVGITAEYRANTHLPILVKANAGLPEVVDGKTVFRMTPEQMAAKVPELVKAGANIIGGCCGTTPAHIAAIARALGRSGQSAALQQHGVA